MTVRKQRLLVKEKKNPGVDRVGRGSVIIIRRDVKGQRKERDAARGKVHVRTFVDGKLRATLFRSIMAGVGTSRNGLRVWWSLLV
jgi:hypothetical protein